ncbi:unnamed protein product, partial [Iphiclides podalirius]
MLELWNNKTKAAPFPAVVDTNAMYRLFNTAIGICALCPPHKVHDQATRQDLNHDCSDGARVSVVTLPASIADNVQI